MLAIPTSGHWETFRIWSGDRVVVCGIVLYLVFSVHLYAIILIPVPDAISCCRHHPGSRRHAPWYKHHIEAPDAISRP